MKIDATDCPTLQVQWKTIHQIAGELPLCVIGSQSQAPWSRPCLSAAALARAFNLTWESGQSARNARWEILRPDCRMASVQDLDLDFPHLRIDPSVSYLFKEFHQLSTPVTMLQRYKQRDTDHASLPCHHSQQVISLSCRAKLALSKRCKGIKIHLDSSLTVRSIYKQKGKEKAPCFGGF